MQIVSYCHKKTNNFSLTEHYITFQLMIMFFTSGNCTLSLRVVCTSCTWCSAILRFYSLQLSTANFCRLYSCNSGGSGVIVLKLLLVLSYNKMSSLGGDVYPVGLLDEIPKSETWSAASAVLWATGTSQHCWSGANEMSTHWHFNNINNVTFLILACMTF